MASPADTRFLRIPNLPDMQRPRCPPVLPLAFVRVRCLRQSLVTNWVRPGVFCDGNPLNLSQPILRVVANSIIRPSPKLWQLVEIDPHGLPLDRDMRTVMVQWFAKKYFAVVPEALLEPPAAAQPAAAPAPQPADPPMSDPPADADPDGAGELPEDDAADPAADPAPLAASVQGPPADPPQTAPQTPAAAPQALSDNRAGRRKAQGGDHVGVRR